MSSFNEANQARLSLKMMLHYYGWYNGSHVEAERDDYIVVVSVSRMDNSIRKIIPIVHQAVGIKVDVQGK
jgi:hypothetical protein